MALKLIRSDAAEMPTTYEQLAAMSASFAQFTCAAYIVYQDDPQLFLTTALPAMLVAARPYMARSARPRAVPSASIRKQPKHELSAAIRHVRRTGRSSHR